MTWRCITLRPGLHCLWKDGQTEEELLDVYEEMQETNRLMHRLGYHWKNQGRQGGWTK